MANRPERKSFAHVAGPETASFRGSDATQNVIPAAKGPEKYFSISHLPKKAV